MSKRFPNAETHHRINQSIGALIDVSGSSATQAKPLCVIGPEQSLDVHRVAVHVVAGGGGSTAAAVNFGITGDLDKFGTVNVPSGAAAQAIVEGILDLDNLTLEPGTIVFASHVQDSDHTSTLHPIFEWGKATQN